MKRKKERRRDGRRKQGIDYTCEALSNSIGTSKVSIFGSVSLHAIAGMLSVTEIM